MARSNIWDGRIEVPVDDAVLVAETLGTDGPLAICVHGFPDTPDTWEEVAPLLRELGYRVVAPFLRGIPPSNPGAGTDWTGERLGNDVWAIVDACGESSALLVGHDWGALAVYSAAALAPERVEKLITLAIPHNGALRPTPRFLWRVRHFRTLAKKGAAERVRRADFQPIIDIARRWSPHWAGLEEDVGATLETLRLPGGIESAIAPYRSFWPTTDAARRSAKLLARPLGVETLTLFGADDGAQDMSAVRRAPKFFTGSYTQIVIDDVGHFIHRENFDAVREAITAFLEEGSAR